MAYNVTGSIKDARSIAVNKNKWKPFPHETFILEGGNKNEHNRYYSIKMLAGDKFNSEKWIRNVGQGIQGMSLSY